jgi:hypothetical protein
MPADLFLLMAAMTVGTLAVLLTLAGLQRGWRWLRARRWTRADDAQVREYAHWLSVRQMLDERGQQ